MSQKAVLVSINGNLVQEVFHAVPDYEDACQICLDNGWDGTEDTIYNYYNVEYEWLDIGEGESGADEFIDAETLLHIYGHHGYEEIIKESYGLDVEVVETGNIDVFFEDLED